MEKCFEDLIVARCQIALTNSSSYLSLENKNCETEEVQDLAQILCYRQGFKDAMRLLREC